MSSKQNSPGPAASRGTLEYRPAIDGLRALAVLSVFIFHLNHAWLPGGFVGVDVFFVISGFLITSIIHAELRHGSFSLGRFYERRIARIFPAFFAVALATLGGAFFFYSPQDLASAGANLAAAALSVSNLKMMSQGNYFAISPDAQPFLHYWSLSVEEQFYIFFPLLLLLLFKFARQRLVLALAALWVASFAASVLLTHLRPVWAFYLLPTRAWELLSGCLLAVLSAQASPAHDWHRLKYLPIFCLGIVVASFWLVRDGNDFPGFWALLPVVGALGLLVPGFGGSPGEKLLAAVPLVVVGRISYSLYLWHWPVFALVDYHLYLAPAMARLALKISLSFLAAIVSFHLLEKPARVFLNSRKSILPALAFMICAIGLCVPLGIAVRKANYVNVEARDVLKGGLVYAAGGNGKSVLLMGDSNASMYGRVLKDICANLGDKLSVISVAGGDPLPAPDVNSGSLWLDSFTVVRREKPDYLVLACAWAEKLQDHKERLAAAVAALQPFVRHLVILNQPPILPENANRAAIRNGVRPPFFEDPQTQLLRQSCNDYLIHFSNQTCSVVDIASHFEKTNGEVLFLDVQGRQLYHDSGHLSGFGADVIRAELQNALSSK